MARRIIHDAGGGRVFAVLNVGTITSRADAISPTDEMVPAVCGVDEIVDDGLETPYIGENGGDRVIRDVIDDDAKDVFTEHEFHITLMTFTRRLPHP